MKTIKKIIFPMLMVSFLTIIYVKNDSNMNTQKEDVYISTNLETNNYSVGFMWTGTGPYGQVDVYPSGGTAPYKWYRGNTLLQTSYGSTTLSFGCNGGVITVKDANNNTSSDIIPQGCVDHGWGQGN